MAIDTKSTSNFNLVYGKISEMNKYRLVLILIFSLIMLAVSPYELAAASTPPKPGEMPAVSGADVIAAINNYRVANGLAALSSNSLLNSLAQAQSSYQATISTVTHTGSDGSSPSDRASAAGYGGGSGFYFSEIIYGGYNASVSDAMTWWQNSSTHNYYILRDYYVEIGAAVVTSDGRNYYTAELAGSYSGSSSSSSGSTDTSSGSSTTDSSTAVTPVAVVIPVQKATPNADGSIYHTVMEGQSLWTIAAVYDIELEKLLDQNGLTSYSYVFPGDEIMIQPPGTEITSTQPETAAENQPEENAQTPAQHEASGASILGTPVAYGDVEQEPQHTNTPIVIQVPTKVSNTPSTTSENETNGFFSENKVIRIIIIIAFICLFIVIVGSIFLQNPQSQEKED